MDDKYHKPPWSWAPNMPKPLIVALALLVDIIAGGTWYYHYNFVVSQDLTFIHRLLQTLVNPSPAPNLATVLALFQFNLEVPYMILTRKRNAIEKEAAVAKATAETEAKFRDWYEANKDNLGNVPPPPFSANGDQPGS